MYYDLGPDECPEDELFFTDEASSTDNKLPVRVLKSYIFYNLKDKQVLPLSLVDNVSIGASGYSRPQYLHGLYEIESECDERYDDMEDTYAPWQLVQLGEICSVYLDSSFTNP